MEGYLKKLEQELIEFAQEVVRIQSYTGEEGDLAKVVKAKMESLEYDEVFIDPLGNVIGVIGNGPKKIMFDSHMDTVVVNDSELWSEGPFKGDIVDGNLFGRGSVDMKSAMAASIYAGHIIKKLGYDKGKTIYVSASVMEEDYDGEPLHYVCQENNIMPDYAVICEPSNLELALGHRGRALLKIHTSGVSAHGSAPEKGVNAVYKMNEIVSRVEALGEKFMAIEGDKGSVALTKIESQAVSYNAIPPDCTIFLDRRLIIGEDLAFITKEMETLLQGTDATWEIHDETGKSWTGETLVLHSFLPAWEIQKDHELTVAFREACKEVNGEEPVMMKWDFCTNGVASARLGIPTIGLGPGDPKLAHMRDEHCPISQIIGACKLYTELINKI